MGMTRRGFIKGCTAAAVVGVPAFHSAQACTSQQALLPEHVEKSIKASFGGGFSLHAHRRSGGLTYANIEHRGNHYTVASTDLFDWAIVSTV